MRVPNGIRGFRVNYHEKDESPKILARIRDSSAILQSLIVSGSILAAGIWAVLRFSVLFEARIATAEAERAEAAAISAKRTAQPNSVVNTELTAYQLSQNSKERWVLIELSLRNTGNSTVDIDLEMDTRFYISRLVNVEKDGLQEYTETRKIQFDYPDKTLTWFHLQPGAELTKFRTVQKVLLPGVYLARFSSTAKKQINRESAEYSAQVYFVVN